jgi:hypothetical protein
MGARRVGRVRLRFSAAMVPTGAYARRCGKVCQSAGERRWLRGRRKIRVCRICWAFKQPQQRRRSGSV